MNDNPILRGKLKKIFFGRLLVFFPIWLAVFFLPAGTFAYWEAWVYLAILFIPMILGFAYWIKNDPQLLERRMRMREKKAEQKRIINIFYLCFLITFLLPGFDHRFEWSNVPVVVVIVADIFILIGYGIFFIVVRENRYASRTIEVEQEQKIISSGPYAIVRHPMYLGVLLMCVSSPLALGSYWAMIPSLLIIPLLAGRIWNEENLLVRELEGYQEYLQKTKYRLIPGIW
jgi:protein-S-isoprenylcysteine O-methyltransferase Ste14